LVFTFASLITKNQKYKKKYLLCFFALLACLVIMSQDNTKLCDFSSTNNNDFVSTPLAPPATSAESYDINVALLNLVMKDQFSGNASEDVASHLNNLVELCDMQEEICG
jgi:hypothetical protein